MSLHWKAEPIKPTWLWLKLHILLKNFEQQMDADVPLSPPSSEPVFHKGRGLRALQLRRKPSWKWVFVWIEQRFGHIKKQQHNQHTNLLWWQTWQETSCFSWIEDYPIRSVCLIKWYWSGLIQSLQWYSDPEAEYLALSQGLEEGLENDIAILQITSEEHILNHKSVWNKILRRNCNWVQQILLPILPLPLLHALHIHNPNSNPKILIQSLFK